MTKEEKHVLLCNSFKTQILAIIANIEQLDGKRDFIFCSATYGYVISHLDYATNALDEIIEQLTSEEEEDEGWM